MGLLIYMHGGVGSLGMAECGMGSGHAKQLILGAAYGDHFEVKNEDIGLITPISGTLIPNNQ